MNYSDHSVVLMFECGANKSNKRKTLLNYKLYQNVI